MMMAVDDRTRAGHPVGDECFVSHLECSATGQSVAHDRLHGLSDAGAPLLVRYDLKRMGAVVDRDRLCARLPEMEMWRELLPLPVGQAMVSLGECVTPLIRMPGSPALFFKDEGRLPTGSFKARGMAVAVTMAAHFGSTALAVPTAGNAGAAAAAYGSVSDLAVHVFTPVDTPDVTMREMAFFGARIYEVDGLIDQCGRLAREASDEMGWHNLATLAEPYRLEGKKTIGLELALQFGWRLPDVVYYPTGGGTGFIGMWKAFKELRALGWLSGEFPRMVSVQTLGCNPIQKAFVNGEDDIAEPFAPVSTRVPGVRVPKPLGGRLILQVLRESGGHACAVSDELTFATRNMAGLDHGISLCPEGGACLAAYKQDLEAGRVDPGEVTVIFNTASGLKWPMPPANPMVYG